MESQAPLVENLLHATLAQGWLVCVTSELGLPDTGLPALTSLRTPQEKECQPVITMDVHLDGSLCATSPLAHASVWTVPTSNLLPVVSAAKNLCKVGKTGMP